MAKWSRQKDFETAYRNYEEVRTSHREGEPRMGIRERSAKRRRRIVAHRAPNFEDAEKWDLDFWQCQTPEQRLSALVAIRKDVKKVERSRLKNSTANKEES